jgi:hypothetical protein
MWYWRIKKMNKIFKWFYDKEKKIRVNELYKAGLRIKDESKYDEYLIKSTKKNIIYNAVFLLVLFIVITRWLL